MQIVIVQPQSWWAAFLHDYPVLAMGGTLLLALVAIHFICKWLKIP